MMPSASRMAPPTNQTLTSREVHPGNVWPLKCAISAQAMTANEMTMKRTPSRRMRRSGRTENEVMPSQANPNMRLSGYFDSPAKRAARSYSTVAWRYPSDFTMPRRKRLRSG